MSAILEQSPNLGQTSPMTLGQLVMVGGLAVVGGLASAVAAAGELAGDSGALRFSGSGAVVVFAIGYGVLSWRLRRRKPRPSEGSFRAQLVEAMLNPNDPVPTVVLAMCLTVQAMGYWVLPSVPRAFGGTAPVCQVLRVNADNMSPGTIAALDGTRTGDEIVTPPVALHLTSEWGIHFVTAHTGTVGLHHGAIIGRFNCSPEEMERYRSQRKWSVSLAR